MSKPAPVAVLCDIRSAYNVGAMFRTADGAGFQKLFLVGITPTPQDRFGRFRKDIAKVALGAEKSLPWEYRADCRELVDELREHGYAVAGLEQASGSRSVYALAELSAPVALFVGSETEGLSSEILSELDAVYEIPMRGSKNSLNVASAFAVAAYALLR